MMKLMLLLTVRSLWLVILTCIQLFLEVINFHARMYWRIISWIVTIMTLPFRALGALHRENKMERLLQEMLSELESLSWRNEKLEARLEMAVKERHLVESMLAEIEEEHDVTIGKIERLEKELEYLKDENSRLKESHTKGLWDSSAIMSNARDPVIHKSSLALQERIWSRNPTGLVDPLVFSSSTDTDLALHQRREVAFFQSVFSALLSLLVGAIIWEAKDPCMPLVMALFSVVGLSLRSVVQFFSTIKNRPASDAVALLSFNWFILGTLTAPTLPRVARVLSPIIFAFLEPGLKRVGLRSPG
ncbi:uncharacterized protein LOC141658858 [Silene latifolia]|uniref:uncharacterized protein LOC141658858 n=1 Tax=Silene latifolia TaxID=37657 RepID=UPI003D76CE2D